MKIIIFLFGFVLFHSLITQINTNKNLLCEELIKQASSESNLITLIDDNMDELKTQLNCIEYFLRHGHHKAGEFYIEELSKRNIQYREVMKRAVLNIVKNLEEINNKFRFKEEEFQKVVPATMWAQSLEHVYLMIKFGHRHDAPGCLEVNKLKYDVSSEDQLVFTANCVQGDVPIKFDLRLDLFSGVVFEDSTFTPSSVGKFQIVLKKRTTPSYWNNLVKEGSYYPPSTKFWFEMRDKFIDDLQPYIDDAEAEEDRKMIKKVKKEYKLKKKQEEKERQEKLKRQEENPIEEEKKEEM